MTNKDHKKTKFSEPHSLGKLHLEAATAELNKGATDKVLFHLTTAQELLRPSSHRHPEIREAIRKLKLSPEKVAEAVSSLELELTIEQAATQLEEVFASEKGYNNLVRKRHCEGNFWELDAFFSGPSELHFVTLTHASPETTFPLMYIVTDHYSRKFWAFSSFAGCLSKIAHLITV